MSPLESKFPFSPQATLEATPQDLATVFDPSTGALTQFYNSALKNLLLPQGTGYIANPAATQAVNPAFLAFFNRAAGVQRRPLRRCARTTAIQVRASSASDRERQWPHHEY